MIARQSEKVDPTKGRSNSRRYIHGNKHLIELRSIEKVYKTAAGDFTALKNIDLQIDSGEFVAVIGKSGSGKSTLVNMITGIDRPTSGQVLVGDTQVHELSEGKVALWRGKNLGIIFQFFQLLPTLTVIENVMLPMDFARMLTPRKRLERAMYLLEQVDMVDHARKFPTAISGGQQQRVAIARALSNDPPILVADEPTGNLDSRTADAVFNLFDELVAGGKTVLMVTHDEEQARRVSRAIIVADGEIINEYLARVFPTLNQEQLLGATRRLEPILFKAGRPIIVQDAEPDNFYIIVKGEAEVVLTVEHKGHTHEIQVATLGSGEFFGGTSLLLGGKYTATIRTVSECEVVALDRDSFQGVLDNSKMTMEELTRILEERRSMLDRARGSTSTQNKL